MTKNKESIWGIGINRAGLWDDKPIKFYYHKVSYAPSYFWDKSGRFYISRLGYEHNLVDNCIAFASKNKKEVEVFIKGADAFRKILVANLKRDRD